MKQITGVISNTENPVIFSVNEKSYDFYFLTPQIKDVIKYTPPIIIEPEDNFVYGLTHDRKKIAIYVGNKSIKVFGSKCFSTDTYFLSNYGIDVDIIDSFDGMSFYGGTVNSVFYMDALDIEIDDHYENIGKLKDDKKSFLIELEDEKIKMEISSEIKIYEGVSEHIIRNDEAVLTIKFQSSKKIDEAIKYYSNICNMLSFMTFRSKVGFDKVCLLKKTEEFDFPVEYAEMFFKHNNNYSLKDTRKNLSINDIEECFPKLASLFLEKKEKRILPMLGFIPENDKDVYTISYKQIKEICSALEYEYNYITDINVYENAAVRQLYNEVKTFIKEYRKTDNLISDGTYDLIFGSIKHWSLSLKDKLYAVREKYEEEISVFNESPYNIDDTAIKEFVNCRNGSTHGGESNLTEKVAETAFCLIGVVYCCILERIGLEKDKLKELCKYRLLK